MTRTAFSLNEINGSESHGEEKKAEPKDTAVDRRPSAVPESACHVGVMRIVMNGGK
jgi:hypothetical protein